MADPLPRLTAAELRDSGLLVEVNRRVLHPLGLAMAVDVEADVIMVLDDRSDPEGWYFLMGADEALDNDLTEEERRLAREAMRWTLATFAERLGPHRFSRSAGRSTRAPSRSTQT